MSRTRIAAVAVVVAMAAFRTAAGAEPMEADTGLAGDPGTAAAAADDEAADAEELAELLTLLAQETAVATKTRVNSDYVPGIVTVLAGEELEALGFATVWESLALVPGIQPVRSGGSPSTIVRGIQFPFNSGNVKVLLDGVPLTRQSAAINTSLLYLPIEQVERIEVIRGPGSVIYGDFAFMGLVNVITRRDGARAYLRGDDDGMRAAGGQVSHGGGEGAWRLAANLAVGVDVDADLPGRRRGEEESGSAVVSLARGGFSLTGQFHAREVDDTTAPGVPGAPIVVDETSWSLDGRWERDLRPALHLAAFATALGADYAAGQFTFEDEVGRLGADLTWDGWARHSWLLGLEHVGQDIVHATARLAPAGPGGPGGPPPALVLEDVSRDVTSVVLQDRVELSERLSLTAGARFDHYSDVASRTTPRLSLVWRASERHIVKAQYAEGFRAPTFFEAYGVAPGAPPRLNRDLDFEVNRTTELNYVHRRPRLTGRVTLFRSELEDMIFVARPPRRGFENGRSASAEGVELEWTQQVSQAVKLMANLSWVDTEDDRGPTLATHQSEAAAAWTSDVALLVRPLVGLTLAGHWYHVDDRELLAGDSGYDLVDLTATLADRPWEGLSVRLGVKNALDDAVVYVSVPPTGVLTGQTFERRSVWLQLAWRR